MGDHDGELRCQRLGLEHEDFVSLSSPENEVGRSNSLRFICADRLKANQKVAILGDVVCSGSATSIVISEERWVRCDLEVHCNDASPGIARLEQFLRRELCLETDWVQSHCRAPV